MQNNIQENTPYPSIKQALILIGIYLLSLIPAGIISFGLAYLIGIDIKESSHSIIMLPGVIIPLGLTLWYAAKKVPIRSLDWNLSSIRQVGILLASIWIVLGSSLFLEPLFELIPNVEALRADLNEMFQPSLTTFFLAVCFAPLAEEILFRGIILRGFAARYGATKGILFSALFFGIFHIQPLQVVGATFIGIVLGWVYLRSRSLTLVILLHAVNNLLAFLMTAYYPNVASTWELIDNPLYYAGLMLVAGVGMFVAIRYIQRHTTELPVSTVKKESSTTTENIYSLEKIS